MRLVLSSFLAFPAHCLFNNVVAAETINQGCVGLVSGALSIRQGREERRGEESEKEK